MSKRTGTKENDAPVEAVTDEASVPVGVRRLLELLAEIVVRDALEAAAPDRDAARVRGGE